MKKTDDAFPARGAVTTLVLAALQVQPMHGYELVRALEARSRGIFSFRQGTVYPLLYSLRDAGCVQASWQAGETGHRRRVYRLTAKGRRVLEAKRRYWVRFEQGMRLALGFN